MYYCLFLWEYKFNVEYFSYDKIIGIVYVYHHFTFIVGLRAN